MRRVALGAARVVRSGWLWISLLLFVLGVTVLITGNRMQYGGVRWRHLFLDNYGNIGVTFLGTVVTILFIDSVARRTERRQSRRDWIASLRSVAAADAKELLGRAR